MNSRIDPASLEDQAQLARLISVIESSAREADRVLSSLPEPKIQPHRIGITGSPGSGKSTLLGRLVPAYREQGHKVAVVAVDPTSPFSGGSILGDRLRISQQNPDPGVFIRSLASRGSLGGVSPSASAVARVLECAGYSRVIIETVGVGQTGYDIICLADTVVSLFTPEGGDGIQLLKAGILEIGDIFAVNKSDRPGAEIILKEIKASLSSDSIGLGHHMHSPGAIVGTGEPPRSASGWQPPALAISSLSGGGISDLVKAIDGHRAYLESLSADHPLKSRRQAREISFAIRSRVDAILSAELDGLVDSLAAKVAKSEIRLQEAQASLVKALTDFLEP